MDNEQLKAALESLKPRAFDVSIWTAEGEVKLDVVAEAATKLGFKADGLTREQIRGIDPSYRKPAAAAAAPPAAAPATEKAATKAAAKAAEEAKTKVAAANKAKSAAEDDLKKATIEEKRAEEQGKREKHEKQIQAARKISERISEIERECQKLAMERTELTFQLRAATPMTISKSAHDHAQETASAISAMISNRAVEEQSYADLCEEMGLPPDTDRNTLKAIIQAKRRYVEPESEAEAKTA